MCAYYTEFGVFFKKDDEQILQHWVRTNNFAYEHIELSN